MIGRHSSGSPVPPDARPDALIQADRRLKRRLQLRVVDDLVMRQRCSIIIC